MGIFGTIWNLNLVLMRAAGHDGVTRAPDPGYEAGEPHKQFCSHSFGVWAFRIAWCKIFLLIGTLVSGRLFLLKRYKNIFEPRAR